MWSWSKGCQTPERSKPTGSEPLLWCFLMSPQWQLQFTFYFRSSRTIPIHKEEATWNVNKLFCKPLVPFLSSGDGEFLFESLLSERRITLKLAHLGHGVKRWHVSTISYRLFICAFTHFIIGIPLSIEVSALILKGSKSKNVHKTVIKQTLGIEPCLYRGYSNKTEQKEKGHYFFPSILGISSNRGERFVI